MDEHQIECWKFQQDDKSILTQHATMLLHSPDESLSVDLMLTMDSFYHDDSR